MAMMAMGEGADRGLLWGVLIWLACGLLLAVVVAPPIIPVAHADTGQVTSTLDTTTVYATRSPRSSFSVPATVSRIDTDTPGDALATDIANLLEFTPGVDVDNGPRRNGQVVSLRGFDDEAVITLMDGRRQNFEAEHDGRFFVDPSLLKAVEIVKGAASAVYGGGGIGGVVAFETRDAADFLAPGETRGALATMGWRSGSSEYAPSVSGFGRFGSMDFLANISYRDSGDIEQGGNSQLHTENGLLSGLFKVSRTFADFHTLRLQAQLLNDDGQEPNNGASAITRSNPIVDKEIVDRQFSLKYSFSRPDNDWLNPKLHVYRNDTEVEERDIGGSNRNRVQTRELDTLGVTVDNQSRFVSRELGQHTLSYGFEFYTDEQVGTRSNPATGAIGMRPGVPRAEASSYGLYLQDEIAFSIRACDFLFIPAVRFDQYSSESIIAGARQEQDENKVSPKFSLSYQADKSLLLFASWARAFRAPNLTELYPSGQHFPAVRVPVQTRPGTPPMFITVQPENRFQPNSNLKPETVTSIEIGAGLDRQGVLAPRDRLQIKGSWFTNDGDDFIAQEIGRTTTQFVNIANARLHGWEVFGQYQLRSLSLKLGLSEVRAENRDTGEHLSNNVPLTLVTDMAWQHARTGSVIGWRLRLAERNDRVPVAEEGDTFSPRATAGYAVHDLYYRLRVPGNADLTLDAGVENLFDKAYTRRIASLREEGRSVVVKVAYQW